MNKYITLLTISFPVFLFGQTWTSDHIMTVDSTFTWDTTYTVDQLDWISGYWVGEGLGGDVEEIWSIPKNGKMFCVFRYDSGADFVFSEHVTMTQTERGLSMLVKHFSADFHAWEEKDQFIDFPLIKIEPNRAYFDGCSFIREDNELKIYVSIEHQGEVKEELFHYHLRE